MGKFACGLKMALALGLLMVEEKAEVEEEGRMRERAGSGDVGELPLRHRLMCTEHFFVKRKR